MSFLSAAAQLQSPYDDTQALLLYHGANPERFPWLAHDDASQMMFDGASTRQHINWAEIGTITQSVLAAVLLFISLVRPLLPPTPLWLRSFAREEDVARRSHPWTYWTAHLGVLASFGLIISFAWLLMLAPSRPFDLVRVIPWLAATLITAVDRPTVASKSLLLLYVSFAVSSAAKLILSHQVSVGVWRLSLANLCISVIAAFSIIAMPMRNPVLSKEGIASKSATNKLRSPEDNLSLWKFMSVAWMSPLIQKGSREQLHDEDVWKLPYEFQHGRLHLLFRDIQGSILKRLLHANGLDLIIISFLGVLETLADLSIPVFLEKLLQSIKAGRDHLTSSILFAAAILVVRLISAQTSVFSLWFSRRCYERSRGEMITTIYAKTLSRKTFGEAGLPPEAPPSEAQNGTAVDQPTTWSSRLLRLFGIRRKTTTAAQDEAKKDQPATTGKILNLMRNDVYEVAQRFWDFPNFVNFPLQFALSFVLVYRLVGWSCLLGLASVLLSQGLNTILIWGLLAAEKIRRKATDDRLQATTQFVEAIRHLRWYDWQDKWMKRVTTTRQKELNARIRTGLWGMGLALTNMFSASLFPVVTFFAFTFIAGRPLTVEVAFPALQLFVMLESSFKTLPSLITVLLNASVAMGRIEKYMAEPDKEEATADSKNTDIQFDRTTLAWPGRESPVLHELNLEFRTGLTVVFGKVGSGKSALLQAILGELDCQQGSLAVPNAMIGYCAQLPWLQHMSIRDNILFSAPYDPERYSQVLDACSLLPDLANFKHGDLSDIGENGIGLSGGQKARVALARAVYSQSQILLLDDPIAALDHQTAESIVRKLFQGPLFEGRNVILVTHRVDLCLHVADQMIEIEDGRARVLNPEEASREIAKFMRDEEAQQEQAEAATAPRDDDQQTAAIPDKFVEDEHRAAGGVPFSVYWTYIKAGTLKLWALVIVFVGLLRLGGLLNYWFLKAWGEAYRSYEEFTHGDFGISSARKDMFSKLPPPEENLRPWLLVYLGIALVQTFFFALFCGVSLVMVYVSSKGLFLRVVNKVSKATFRFYDVTPVGRLMNRLVSDIGMIDGGIISPLQQVVWMAMMWISSMVVIASTTPVFLVFSIGMTIWFVIIFRQFLPTSQSLRRLEMASLSPLMSNFGILLDGLATIRAFKAQPHFQNKNIEVTDVFQKMDHFYWSLQSWLMYRFDALSAVSTFALTLLALYNGLSPGLTAFILTTAAQFVKATHGLCKIYGTLQMDFVSVERVIELLDLPEEPQGKIQPPAVWPSGRDDITFDNVTLRYAEHLDPSIENATFKIPSGSTCAVLGRTGSGKSTLALALLATMHPSEGSIHVGSMDLADVDVHQWRQRVSFVAQDPVLFPGTLRENLDPLEQFTDDECMGVLRRVLGAGWELDSPVEGGGKNLSQGQRQLVGIGRAVLRRSAVVILDEATASIDKETAERVQDILREELTSSTVITIAHRLEAVKDADFFVRLDAGRVVGHGRANNSD